MNHDLVLLDACLNELLQVEQRLLIASSSQGPAPVSSTSVSSTSFPFIPEMVEKK